MKIWLIFIVFSLQVAGIHPFGGERSGATPAMEIAYTLPENVIDAYELYDACDLTGKLDYHVFKVAYSGYNKLDKNANPFLTIIDYTRPSTEKRMFIIDLQKQELVFHTLVAHGKNSGANMATLFSNKKMSLKSSPGFYMTGETYHGKHGYSLRLDGIEKGINNNARSRAIVIHGASYVSPQFIQKYKRLGRSWGCPAVPKELSKEIIDTIKGGSYIYIHTSDQLYYENSVLARLSF